MSNAVEFTRAARVAEQLGRLRRAAATSSLGFFARTYLPARFHLPFCPMHHHLLVTCEWMLRERDTRVVFAMPPGHGKSSIGVVAHVLWAAACHGEKSIVIVRPTPEEARRTLCDVGAALEGAERLQRDFPGAAPKPPSAWAWTASGTGRRATRSVGSTVVGAEQWGEFATRTAEPDTRRMHALLHGRAEEMIAPTIDGDPLEAHNDPLALAAGPPIVLRNGARIAAIGVGQSMMGQRAVGHRPTLVVLDDPEMEVQSPSGPRITPARRELAPWLEHWLPRLAPRANVLMVGSVIGYHAVMADLLDVRLEAPWGGIGYGVANQRPGDPRLWSRCVEIAKRGRAAAAIPEARRFYDEHKPALVDGVRALWPERWDDFDLAMIEEKVVDPGVRRAAFEARWVCVPSMENVSEEYLKAGWSECDRSVLMVCQWMAENEALAAKMDCFDADAPASRPRLWVARRGSRGSRRLGARGGSGGSGGAGRGRGEGWMLIDLFHARRELRTPLRQMYLDHLARMARLGSNFDAACAAFTDGVKPCRGEAQNRGDAQALTPWPELDEGSESGRRGCPDAEHRS